MVIRKSLALTLFILVILSLGAIKKARAPVPVTVIGYVYMLDGSKAVGAIVTVSGGGEKKTVTTNSEGKYQADLTVSSLPVTIKVTAKKGSYYGSKSKTVNPGDPQPVRIDIKLKESSQQGGETSKKEKVEVIIRLSRLSYSLGDTVYLNGTTSPAVDGKAEIFITCPNGTINSYKVTVSKGLFSFTFKADVLGRWEVYAYFLGNEKYGASKSNTVTFYVKLKPEIRFAAVAKGSREIEVRGSISPSGQEIPITLYISIDGGRSWLPYANTTTDQSGNFQIELNLTVTGNLLLKLVTQETEQLLSVETQKPVMFKLESPTEQLLRRQLEEALQAQANLTTQIQQLKKENQQLKEQLEKLHSQLETTSQELIQAQNASRTLQAQLENLRKENQQLRNMLTLALPLTLVAGAAGSLAEHFRTRRKNQEKD